MSDSKEPLVAGRYELLNTLASGGMATVWRAMMHGAAGFRRPVAIKRILPKLVENRDFVKMFVEEARVGSHLHHPNIVQIIDFSEDDGGAYLLVMEWVEGIDFGGYLQAFHGAGQKAPWPLTVAIGIEVLRGLRAAHDRVDTEGKKAPVIHRDVTPSNILIGVNGIVKLSDFGLSRAMDRARITDPDIVKGKLSYLAPELAYGKSASVQSDLFSLGVVLWEALIGRKLYQETNQVDLVLNAREAQIPSIVKYRQDLPPKLVQAIERALARDPSERYLSAQHMLKELKAVLRTVPQSTDAADIRRAVLSAQRILRQFEERNRRNSAARAPA